MRKLLGVHSSFVNKKLNTRANVSFEYGLFSGDARKQVGSIEKTLMITNLNRNY